MEVPAQQKCSFTRKAPKLSRLQKPQPRKQAGETNISHLQKVINKNSNNLQNSSTTSDSENILYEVNNCSNVSKNERCKDMSVNQQCCDDDVVITGISRNGDVVITGSSHDDDVVITGTSHIPLSYSRTLLEEATNNLMSVLNVDSHNHLRSGKEKSDVNAGNVVTSSPDEVKKNLVDEMSQVVKRRAPRGSKLTRPPPLKTKPLRKNYEVLEMELMNYIERLLDDRLSLQCTLQFRDFISKNGAQIDEKNKGLMDNCFDCIQEAITRNTLDSVVEINLKDILLLRRQRWQPTHLQDQVEKGQTLDVTWKEISMNLSGSSDSYHCDSEDTERSPVMTKTCNHLIQTQQSTDSGFGEDEILWECEEEFRKDLQEINGFSKTRLEDIPEAESRDNRDIEELLAGIQIIGDDQGLVAEAENILRSHFNRRESISPTPVSAYLPPAPQEKHTVPTSPVDYMPPQLPKIDTFKPQCNVDQSKASVPPSHYWCSRQPPPPPPLKSVPPTDQWYLLTPPPQLPLEEEPERHPIRLNRQLSEVKQKYDGIVTRQPIGAGISLDMLQEIEKTMPDGMFTARGRRAMFSRYRTAMGKTSFTDIECVSYKYTKEELLACSDSVHAKEPPAEWSYLEKIYPQICLKKASFYFDRRNYLRSSTENFEPSNMWQALARRDSVPSQDHAVILEETCMW